MVFSKQIVMVRSLRPAPTVQAGTISLFIIRAGELENGVPIKDPATGVVVGNSTAAAKEGLLKCTAARVLWNIPILVMWVPLLVVLPSAGSAAGTTVVALRAGSFAAASTTTAVLP